LRTSTRLMRTSYGKENEMKLNALEWTYACVTSWFEDILNEYPVTVGLVIGLAVGIVL